MATKEHVLHLRRHLAARKPTLVGKKVPVLGGAKDETAFVGNGIHPDGHVHLEAAEPLKGEAIGRTLYVPEGTETVLLYSSPLRRAQETETYMFNGMVDAYAIRLGVADPSKLTADDQLLLNEKGLHMISEWTEGHALQETSYRNSNNNLDDGNELVAQAYSETANPHFPGYRWMVQKGFEEDQRSEHPASVAQMALLWLIPKLADYDVTLSVTHQPILEIVTATLTDDLGADGNKVFANAGGPFDVGGGIELRVQMNGGRISDAQLRRTEDADRKKELGDNYKGVTLVRTMHINMDTLLRYAKHSPRIQRIEPVNIGTEPQKPEGD